MILLRQGFGGCSSGGPITIALDSMIMSLSARAPQNPNSAEFVASCYPMHVLIFQWADGRRVVFSFN